MHNVRYADLEGDGVRVREQHSDTVRFLRGTLGDLRLETRLRQHVEMVVAICGNNQSLAANVLGLHRRTLQRILRRMERGQAPGGRRYSKPR